MPERKDYLFHEHHGKPHAFRQGGDTSLYGVWYTRWFCSFSNCTQVVLLIKPDNQQKTIVRGGEVASAYGFEVDEIVVDRKTGRNAKIMGFQTIYVWRHFDGRKQRVPSDAWEIIYRWIEPDPRKPNGRIMDTNWGLDHVKFTKRFRKQDA